MPSRSPSPKRTATTPERESALSLFLRGMALSALIALLLVAWSPTEIPRFSLQALFGSANGRHTVVLLPTPTVRPALRIGIISGHWKNDSGATCPDGLQEVDVNHAIALRVQADLQKAGYVVDLLSEFDPRLDGYRAAALVSIHADVCEMRPDLTGFKTAPAIGIEDPAQLQNSQHLQACLNSRYAAATGLPYHATSVSRHMTRYHAFREIAPSTPAVIIETGFLGMDRALLVNHPDVVAQGIAAGILCYLRNEPLQQPTATP